jgi:metallo-beta-lactamase family protein
MSNNNRGSTNIEHSFSSLFSGVTGSRILNYEKDSSETEEIKYCVDFGLHMGGREIGSVEAFSNNYYLPDYKSIQFILLTHAHTDHEGLLPFLVRNGYRNPIYCTKATHAILYHALVDNQKCLVREHHPLYELTDVITTLSLIEDVEYNEPFYPIKKHVNGKEIVNERIKVTFFPNGHLLGSAQIFVEEKNYYRQRINVLFTGDYKRKNIFFDVKDIPKWIYKLPINIVIESTYGDKDSKTLSQDSRNTYYLLSKEVEVS